MWGKVSMVPLTWWSLQIHYYEWSQMCFWPSQQKSCQTLWSGLLAECRSDLHPEPLQITAADKENKIRNQDGKSKAAILKAKTTFTCVSHKGQHQHGNCEVKSHFDVGLLENKRKKLMFASDLAPWWVSTTHDWTAPDPIQSNQHQYLDVFSPFRY